MAEELPEVNVDQWLAEQTAKQELDTDAGSLLENAKKDRELEELPDVDIDALFAEHERKVLSEGGPEADKFMSEATSDDGLMDFLSNRYDETMKENREYLGDMFMQLGVGTARDVIVNASRTANIYGPYIGATLSYPVYKAFGKDSFAEIEKQQEQAMTATEMVPDVKPSEHTELNVLRSIGVWAADYYTLGKVSKGLGWAKDGVTKGQIVEKFIRGELAAGLAFSEQEKRFSEVLSDMEKSGELSDAEGTAGKAVEGVAKGYLNTAFGEYLASNEGDSLAERKFKQLLENTTASLGIAGMFSTLFAGAKHIKGMKTNEKIISTRQEQTKLAKKSLSEIKSDLAKFQSDYTAEGLTKAQKKLVKRADPKKVKAEPVPLEVQRKAAERLGISKAEFLKGEINKKLADSDAFQLQQASLNFKSSAAQEAVDALDNIAVRLDKGDTSALKDFDDIMLEYAEVHKIDAQVSSAEGRALGARAHELEARGMDRLMQVMGGASDQDKIKYMQMFTDLRSSVYGKERGTQKFIDLMDKAARKASSSSNKIGDQPRSFLDVMSQLFTGNILAGVGTVSTDTVGNAFHLATTKVLEPPLAAAIGAARNLGGGRVSDKVFFRESMIFWQEFFTQGYDALKMVATVIPDAPAIAKRAAGLSDDAGRFSKYLDDVKIDNQTRFGRYADSDLITAENIKSYKEFTSRAIKKVTPDDSVMRGKITNFANPVVESVGNILNYQNQWGIKFLHNKDQVIKNILYKSNRKTLAHRKAASEGLGFKTDDYIARIDELMNDVVDDLDSQIHNGALELNNKSKAKLAEFAQAHSAKGNDGVALAYDNLDAQYRSLVDAQRDTFTQQSPRMRKLNNFLATVKGMSFIVPFVTTPWNIARTNIDNIVGGPKAIKMYFDETARLAEGATKADLDVAVARMGVSVGVVTAAVELANRNLITGSHPKSAIGEMRNLEIPENAIWDGERWITGVDQLLAPLAPLLFGPATVITGANMTDANEDKELQAGVTEALWEYTAGMAKTFSNTIFMKNLAELMGAINEGDTITINKVIENIASGVAVPAWLNEISKATDDNIYRAEGILEKIKVRAGFGEAPIYDQYGRKLKRRERILPLLRLEEAPLPPDWQNKLALVGAEPEPVGRKVPAKRFSGIGEDGKMQFETIAEDIEITGHDKDEISRLIGEVKVNGLTLDEWIQANVTNDDVWKSSGLAIERDVLGIAAELDVQPQARVFLDNYNQYKDLALVQFFKNHPEYMEKAEIARAADAIKPRTSSFVRQQVERNRAAAAKRDVPSLSGVQ